MKEKITNVFLNFFGHHPNLIAKSPGRINLIGEHIDYNGGMVLPAAIDRAVYLALSYSADDQIILYAADYQAIFTTRLTDVRKTDYDWANYILGVVHELQMAYPVKGFKAVILGDLPIGAGLSSSAAVECVTVFGLANLFNLSLTRLDMALIAQRAEHTFAGVQCGIMDMFASLMGKERHAILLDCNTLQYEHVQLGLEGYELVLLNTNVKHSLADGQYNLRRQYCQKGLAIIQQLFPSVNNLAEVTEAMLVQALGKDESVFSYCHFVVKEAQRVKDAYSALKSGDLVLFGQKMYQTHDGLSTEYQVSCPELDYLVNYVRTQDSVLGARMMGGGFGGCTINLAQHGASEKLVHQLSSFYKRDFGISLSVIRVNIENGTSLI